MNVGVNLCFFSLLFFVRLQGGFEVARRLYTMIVCFLFLHDHRETSSLTGELSEESDQFRFLFDVWLANLKGSVDLILTKPSR